MSTLGLRETCVKEKRGRKKKKEGRKGRRKKGVAQKTFEGIIRDQLSIDLKKTERKEKKIKKKIGISLSYVRGEKVVSIPGSGTGGE